METKELINMRRVTQQEFYRTLYATCTPANDIMPHIRGSEYPYKQEWRNQKVRDSRLFGVTQGDEYFLTYEWNSVQS